MEPIVVVLLLAAWIAIIRSHQKIRDQQEELGTLTRRLWALEQRGQQGPPAPQPQVHVPEAAATQPAGAAATQPGRAAATQPGRPQKTMVYPTG